MKRRKRSGLKISIFIILTILIIALHVILINELTQPQIMLSPGLGPVIEQNFTFLALMIFGSIALSLVILFVLFYFFIVKS